MKAQITIENNQFKNSVYNSILFIPFLHSLLIELQMGQQPSTLNCKVNQNNQKHEVIHTKQFFLKKKIPLQPQDQSDSNNSNFTSENVIPPKSPRTEITRTTSEKNISSKSSRQLNRLNIFIPEHEAITKASQISFKGSVKAKKLYVEEKLKSLAEIVESRYNTAKHFPYSQILSLTQSLAYGLAYMTKKKCNRHDFYPTNIYYSEGRFKVINPLQLACSGFYLTCQRQRFSFLSPELIIAILEETSEFDLGEDCMNKSDVFAIGMILLEVCSLQPSSECYDEESYNIVDSVIKERLAKVVKVYTPLMAQCINLMLQYEAQARIDPIGLAQLVHWKIENQKLIAIQMEAPKQPQQVPVPHQGPPGPPGLPGQKMMPPPQNMPPQHVRGPPPPYMHQPFMMQNLNPNVIAVSLPNEQFARIGPNNQGFLSSSSLQQKLRVIELIKQHPKEDDEEQLQEAKQEQNSRIEFEGDKIVKSQVKQGVKTTEMRSVFQQKQETKPQYPFVESIYSEKPLMQVNFEAGRKMQPQMVRQTAPQIRQNMMSQAELSKFPLVREPTNITPHQISSNIGPYQVNEYKQRKVQNCVREEVRAPLVQGYEDKNVHIVKGEQIKPRSPVHVHKEPPKQPVYTFQAQNYVKSQIQPSQFSTLRMGEPVHNSNGDRVQIKIDQNNKFMTSQSYGTSTSKNSSASSTINNIYTVTQTQKCQTSFGHIQAQSGTQNSTQSYTKKYGTSFQPSTATQNSGESIQERVQRVLNMSRNAK